MPKTLKYFAYGSNLHPLRLRERAVSCRALGVAEMQCHTLRFHKRGADRSAKCNAHFTGRSVDRVIGVIYEISAEEKAALDRAEGPGYAVRQLHLKIENREHLAFAYIAHPEHTDDTLRPYTWYRELVFLGAYYHGLPAAYTAVIARVEALPDADVHRVQHHERILSAIRAS